MAFLSRFLTEWRHTMIIPYLKGAVLDIGCGNAVILTEYREYIDSYVGVELNGKRVEQLSSLFPEAVFIKRDIDRELLKIESSFDVILLIAVIEHVWNQKFVFEQLIPLLKPNGKIIITTPTPFGNDIVHRFGAKIGIFAQSAVNDHIVIYNKTRFQNLANEFDLKILKYKRFQFYSNQLAVLEKKG